MANTPLDEIKPPQLPPHHHHHHTPLFSKDKQFVGMEKLQKRKFLTGRLKAAEKVDKAAATHSVGRKTKFNEFAKKRGPKPKLRLFGNSRGTMSVSD